MKKANVTKVMVTLLALLLATSLVGACAQPAPAPAPKPAPEPIVWKALTFVPKQATNVRWATELFKRVNEQAKGELVIQYVGGPEAIPGFDQPEAVMNGVAHITAVPMAFYVSQLPEASAAFLTQVVPSKQRTPGGLYDLWVELNEKVNLRYIGRPIANNDFSMGTNVEIKNPRTDFKGLKLRQTGAYEPLYKALGIAGVRMKGADIYTGMERSLLDGWTLPLNGAVDSYSLQEVTKYFIDYPLYPAGTTSVIANLDAWNKLPEHLQRLIIDIQTQLEPEMEAWFPPMLAESRKKAIDGGMIPLKFSAEDAKWFLDLAWEEPWKVVKKNVSPEMYTRLREASVKK